MQFIFAPFWGSLSDKIGRRPIVLLSVLISAVGYFLFAFAALFNVHIVWLFLARGISGFGNANIGAAQAIVADTTTPENRSKGMGLIGAAFGLGFIFGPALGAGLSQIHPVVPLLTAGGLAIINFLLAFKLLPETRSQEMAVTERKLIPIHLIKESTKYVNVSNLILLSLIITAAFAQMEQAITLYIDDTFVTGSSYNTERIKEAAKLTGYFLIVIGVTATIIQGGLIKSLTRKFGEVRLIQFGIFVMGTSLFMIPLAGHFGKFWVLMLIAPYMATGSGLVNPSKSSLLSQSIPQEKQGAILGLNQSASSLGRVIGPLLAAELYTLRPDYPFFIGGTMILFMFTVGYRLKPQVERKQTK